MITAIVLTEKGKTMSDRTATWIRKTDKYHKWWECSACHEARYLKEPVADHCPRCGCKMEREKINGQHEE